MSMRSAMYLAALLTCSTASGSNCTEASPVTGFEVENYLGKWYEIAVSKRFYDKYESTHSLCVTAEYAADENGTITVLNTAYNSTGGVNTASGVAVQPNASEGSLEVTFDSPWPAPYDIIYLLEDAAGNYTVALVWSCRFFGVMESLYVLAREPYINESVYDAVMEYAVETGIDVAALQMIRSVQNCTEGLHPSTPPTPAPPVYAVTPWPLQCQSASPLAGFNSTEYLGKWYQLAVSRQFFHWFEKDYPLCVTMEYSLIDDGTLRVVKQGYNEYGEPSIATGLATVEDPTVASLSVWFFLPLFASSYNVIYMATDDAGQYKTALVWSCSFGGLVQSLWVLSRDNTISDDEYNAAIDFARSKGIDVEYLEMLQTVQTCATD